MSIENRKKPVSPLYRDRKTAFNLLLLLCFDLSLEFPIATNSGDGSFNFVLAAPDAAVWGEFNNGYGGSSAQEADEAWSEVATCQNSSIWNSVSVE